MSNGQNGAQQQSVKAEVAVTPATEWLAKTNSGFKYRLPGSGNVAKLRRPSLYAMAARGTSIPNPLSAEVMRYVTDKGDVLGERSEDERNEIYIKNAIAFVHIAVLCMVEPKLITDRTPNYEKGEIGPENLADLDYQWITFSFVEGSVERTDSFRVDKWPSEVGLPGEKVQSTAIAIDTRTESTPA